MVIIGPRMGAGMKRPMTWWVSAKLGSHAIRRRTFRYCLPYSGDAQLAGQVVLLCKRERSLFSGFSA